MDKTHLNLHITQFIRLVFIFLIIALFSSVLIRVWFLLRFNPLIQTEKTAPDAEIAVIFGAGLRRDGKPTRVLRDRIDTGIALFNAGRVQKLLMSGSQMVSGYDEVSAMREYAESNGIPPNAILMDGRGFSTRQTCENIASARIKNVLLITQNFHLPRALFYCSEYGINSTGVLADKPGYRTLTLALWNMREIPVSFVAFVQNLCKIK